MSLEKEVEDKFMGFILDTVIITTLLFSGIGIYNDIKEEYGSLSAAYQAHLEQVEKYPPTLWNIF